MGAPLTMCKISQKVEKEQITECQATKQSRNVNNDMWLRETALTREHYLCEKPTASYIYTSVCLSVLLGCFGVMEET